LCLPPQVDLTTNGKTMIKNFLFDISGCTGNYTLQGRELECLKYVKETVGSNKVLVSMFIFCGVYMIDVGVLLLWVKLKLPV